MKNKGTKNGVKYFTERELSLFFKQLERERKMAQTEYSVKCAIRNEALFKIMYYCALRVSETLNLKTENYNNLNKELYCVRMKGGLNNTLEIVDSDILRALKRHINFNQPEIYLFENMKANKPLSRKTLDALIKKICLAAGLKKKDKWHCHTLRHTRAIQLAERGFDLKELQYWLGHADVSNTLIYFEFTSKQHAQLYRKLKGREHYEV